MDSQYIRLNVKDLHGDSGNYSAKSCNLGVLSQELGIGSAPPKETANTFDNCPAPPTAFQEHSDGKDSLGRLIDESCSMGCLAPKENNAFRH